MLRRQSKFDVCTTFANGAKEILAARERCGQIHGTSNIRAAGNELEVAVREYVAQILSERVEVLVCFSY